jgi:putative ABC transport system permease protein
LMLLVGSGLLIRTFIALQHADLGFNPDHVLAGFVLPQRPAYRTDAQRLVFYDAVLARAAALPGVTHAALSSVLPLGGDTDMNFVVEGRPAPRSEADTPIVWYREVSANYFTAMGIPLRRGRLFADREAMRAVVINETMARRYWSGEDPLGRRIQMNGEGPWRPIIGVVADVQVRGARGEAKVEAYVPYWQAPEAGTNIVLKTTTDPAALAEPLRRAVKEIDPAMAVAGLKPMEQVVADANGPSRFYATLVATFAVIAVLLAAIGLYGVMSYAVAMRTQEIGVRVALGAAERQIFGLVVGDTLKIVLIGIVIGAAGAAVVARTLRSLLFAVGGTDPLTFSATAAILACVAFAASYAPARRAMRIDPAEALRAE